MEQEVTAWGLLAVAWLPGDGSARQAAVVWLTAGEEREMRDIERVRRRKRRKWVVVWVIRGGGDRR